MSLRVNSRLMLLLMLLVSPVLNAMTQYCSDEWQREYFDVNVSIAERQSLPGSTPATVAMQARQFDSRWALNSFAEQRLHAGFRWRYSIVDIQGLDAMSNGHLHGWFVPFEGRVEMDESILYYELVPGLAVSSNILKSPDLMGSDSFQLGAGAVVRRPASASHAWLLGLRADHRFGDYKAYPVMGLCIEPAPDWSLQLAIPDLRIEYRIGQHLALGLFAAPAGASWRVASKDEARQSQFEYKATAIGLTVQWRLDPAFSLILELEKQRDRELAFRLNDNSLIETTAADSSGLRLRGIYRF